MHRRTLRGGCTVIGVEIRCLSILVPSCMHAWHTYTVSVDLLTLQCLRRCACMLYWRRAVRGPYLALPLSSHRPCMSLLSWGRCPQTHVRPYPLPLSLQCHVQCHVHASHMHVVLGALPPDPVRVLFLISSVYVTPVRQAKISARDMQTGRLVFYESEGRILSGMILDVDGVELQVHSTRQANIKGHRVVPLYTTTKGKHVQKEKPSKAEQPVMQCVSQSQVLATAPINKFMVPKSALAALRSRGVIMSPLVADDHRDDHRSRHGP